MTKAKVLFICVHNSARSRMAEAFLNAECGDFYEAQSAGLEPGSFNPLAAEAMDELGLDIRQTPSQAVSDVLRSGPVFSHVVTVCHESEAAGCPIFPGSRNSSRCAKFATPSARRSKAGAASIVADTRFRAEAK
ncbi:hypothetical protein BH20VER1_BH20VER1_26340 [soil metagenome]